MAHSDAPSLLWFDDRFSAGGPAGNDGSRHAAGLRVLVVDDNPLLRFATASLLGVLQIEPSMAASGEEAVVACRDADYDIVLMDLLMPGIGGLAASRVIRAERDALRRRRPLPIVAYTSTADRVHPTTLLQYAITALLLKPCTSDEMADCLKRCGVTVPSRSPNQAAFNSNTRGAAGGPSRS